MMENKNPLVQLISYGKVKKMMMQFKGTGVDKLERNMMRGMFLRKIKDFSELQYEKSQNLTLKHRLKN